MYKPFAVVLLCDELHSHCWDIISLPDARSFKTRCWVISTSQGHVQQHDNGCISLPLWGTHKPQDTVCHSYSCFDRAKCLTMYRCDRSLSNNGLASLSDGLFDRLVNLQSLFETDWYSAIICAHAKHANWRQLDINAIKHLPPQIFSRLHLKALWVFYAAKISRRAMINHLGTWAPTSLQHLTRICRLNCNPCLLDIYGKGFIPIASFWCRSLSQNAITYISTASFNNIKTFSVL